MSVAIKKLYTDKGLTPPGGKGIHKKKFHEIAAAIMADKKAGKSDVTNPYAVAMSQLGRTGAVKKGHRRYGKPRTDTERKARHKGIFGTSKLPERGTGLGNKNPYQEAVNRT